MDDIPEFLRIPAEIRRAAWKDRRLTTVKTARKRRAWHLPKTIDAVGLALLHQQQREAKERKQARLAALKNRRPR